MIDIRVDKAAINADRLDLDLRAALGVVCHGLSFAQGAVTVHLADAATPQQQDQARAIVAAHNPADLTPEQQQARDRDALPFFALSQAELMALAESMDALTFRREMARAFACLRDLVRGR